MDLRAVRLLPVGPGESLYAGPVHRVYVERRLRRGGRGPRALLFSHAPGILDVEAAPLLCAGLIGYRSLVMAGPGRRLGLYGFGAAAHIVAQVAPSPGQKRLRLHPSRRSDGAGVRPFAGERSGPGARMGNRRNRWMPPSSSLRWVLSCRWRSKPWAREERWSWAEST